MFILHCPNEKLLSTKAMIIISRCFIEININKKQLDRPSSIEDKSMGFISYRKLFKIIKCPFSSSSHC